MKHSSMLTIASLLSILLLTFHLTDDIVRGMEPGGLSNLIGGCSSPSSGCTERWCSPNGDRGRRLVAAAVDSPMQLPLTHPRRMKSISTR
jgi:hypothetical protein